jgi:hypothetical protein
VGVQLYLQGVKMQHCGLTVKMRVGRKLRFLFAIEAAEEIFPICCATVLLAAMFDGQTIYRFLVGDCLVRERYQENSFLAQRSTFCHAH